MHQRCATDIIILIVQTRVTKFSPTILKIRGYIGCTVTSNTTVKELKKRQLHNGLQERIFQLDNNTRWNFTFLMLAHFWEENYIDITVATTTPFPRKNVHLLEEPPLSD